MIFLIAFLHAIPVLIVGMGTHTRGRVIGTAAFMAVIGLVTGNVVYIAIDLVAVGLALGYCLSKADDGNGSDRQTRHQENLSVNSLRRQADAGPSNSQRHSTTGGQDMGFLSAMRLSSIYEQRIRAYGFEPRSLPPDLHSVICSSFERRAERYASMSGKTGRSRSESIQASIELAADLVVLCCIGPTAFAAKGGQFRDSIISDIAKTALESGLEGSLESNVMNSINQAGFIHMEFVEVFRVELKRHRHLNAVREQVLPASYDATAADRAAGRLARAAKRQALAKMPEQDVIPDYRATAAQRSAERMARATARFSAQQKLSSDDTHEDTAPVKTNSPK